MPKFVSDFLPCCIDLRTLIPSAIVAIVTFFGVLGHVRVVRAEVDFLRDVQPILAEHCTQCHGVDEESRQGGLRLDVREDALRGGDSGVSALSPQSPEESSLLQRIRAEHESELMPPPELNNPLNESQIAILDAWIREGAPYANHWAFEVPTKAAIPENARDLHPIDFFVRSRLTDLGLQPAPRAEPELLARRLYLDVIGLPPSPEEVDEFAKLGLEAVLEKLLASERYGEKWARHWLDIARYSDTNGYEKDVRREQWVYRDWVIRALNQDMPYDQFVIEQIAGDLLPNATQDQIIATGFLRNSMINEEGAIVPEQFRMVEQFDRMDCIGKGILGLSLQCAQCHTHKFDPITHEEYYGLFHYINNTYEAQSWVYTPEQLGEIEAIRNEVASWELRIREAIPDWQQQIASWEAEVKQQQVQWTPVQATELGSVSGLNHPAQQPDHSLLMLGHGSGEIYVKAIPDLKGTTGLRLEILTHGDLPFTGPGRSSVGSWGLSEIEITAKTPDSNEWQKLTLANASADFSEPETLHGDAKKSHGPVKNIIDGDHATLWKADRGPGRRNQPSVSIVQFQQPLDLPAGTELRIALHMTDMIGCCRISLTTAPNPVAPGVEYAAILAMESAPEARTVQQQEAIFTGWRLATLQSPVEGQPHWNEELAKVWQRFPKAPTSVLHLASRPNHYQRETRLLERGAWDRPTHPVHEQTPAALHAMQATDEPPRLTFARWLVDRRSPLAARVAVNRVWQAIFGEGLQETSEDFGTRSPLPEHRELLDWLAVEFMEQSWSHKKLLRLILTSDTYQQSSRVSPESLERDPRNRYLSRGPRFRADAEVLRDIALTASGLISYKMGGPGVIPPVPQNVLDYNYVYPSYWTPAEGSERYRRTVYGFRKRSMPDPVLNSFDGPNGDLACARRPRSNTPLAALASLNEVIFVEAARALALRVLREAGPSDEERIERGFLLCTSRAPSPQEVATMLDFIKEQRQRVADGWLNPREVATGNAATLPQLPPATTPQDAAVWTMVARILLNLDETLCKN